MKDKEFIKDAAISGVEASLVGFVIGVIYFILSANQKEGKNE